MQTRVCSLLIASLLLVPAAASARDVAGCAALYRQLQNTPQVIGSTAETRRYAQDLARQNNDIRRLRTEMRRSGCNGSGGSIVSMGRAADQGACTHMQQSLDRMEQDRSAIEEQRNIASQLVRPTQERTMLLAAIRDNRCIPSDVEEDRKERLKVQGIELPKEEPGYSGITTLRTTPPAQQPSAAAAAAPKLNLPGPERPYDPSKKVRTVGPVFLPEESIDLAHPKSGSGPQPQQ